MSRLKSVWKVGSAHQNGARKSEIYLPKSNFNVQGILSGCLNEFWNILSLPTGPWRNDLLVSTQDSRCSTVIWELVKDLKRFLCIWIFPQIVVPQNGWLIMKNPIKMDDLGVPLFLETPIYFRFPNHDFQNHHVKFVFSHSQMDWTSSFKIRAVSKHNQDAPHPSDSHHQDHYVIL